MRFAATLLALAGKESNGDNPTPDRSTASAPNIDLCGSLEASPKRTFRLKYRRIDGSSV